MSIHTLRERPDLAGKPKTLKCYESLGDLVRELRARPLPEPVAERINPLLESLNKLPDDAPGLRKEVCSTRQRILGLLEKELKWVARNHYRNRWMALGMAVFGIPMGAALGASLGNMAFLGIGLPVGMSIGMAVGAGMDKKAHDEGRQLQSVVL